MQDIIERLRALKPGQSAEFKARHQLTLAPSINYALRSHPHYFNLDLYTTAMRAIAAVNIEAYGIEEATMRVLPGERDGDTPSVFAEHTIKVRMFSDI